MLIRRLTGLAALISFGVAAASLGAEPGRAVLSGHVPAAVARLAAKGRLPATNTLSLAIGLPLRNPDQLDELLRQLYDPASTNYHKYLTPAEFTARFGPTEADYAAVKEFARTNGLAITATPDSRLLLDVSGPAAAVEKAFHITLKTYRHPTEARDFFAPDTEPAVAADLPVADISGLTDFYRISPKSHRINLPARSGAVAKSGSAPDGYSYFGNDFQNAYIPGTTLTGAGQMVGLLQFDGFYSNDIAAYAAAAGGGRTNIVIQTVLLDGFTGVPTTGASSGNPEVSLDIELAMAMAPGLSKIIVFEAPNNTAYFNDVLNAMASTNTYPLLNNLSCSWGYNGGPQSSSETIFKKMAAQGQSFFNASGDSDAFTGLVPFPSDSTNITQVGGTYLYMNGAGVSYASETAWNRNNGTGSSGGISTTYGIPYWQQGISMAANGGSTIKRNIPDVAFTADYCYVILGNGNSAAYGGTSCAAPLWAGFMALVNQQAAAAGQNPAGFINPAVYAIGKSSVYNSCFNDITTGNNFSTSSPTNFPAVLGYDLCTGWGTPNGTNLVNAILWPPPSFTVQPVGKTVTNGTSVTFSATAASTTALTYAWLFNGTNLADGGNISGSASHVLTITAATTNNSGNYQLVASNLTGSVVSSVAVLNVGFVPTVSVSPASLTLLAGSNAVFTATPGGSSPFSYRWKKNGTNFSGSGISGTNTTVLTLAGVTTNSTANYTVVVTNLFGSVTSSVASLLVVTPAAIAGSSVTNRTVECNKNTNTFTLTTAGTTPLAIQWSFNGMPVAGATNASFALTNLSVSTNIVAVAVTNFYSSAASNATLAVRDTLPPVITLNGASRMTNELGGAFADPGATANDICVGAVSVSVSGTVVTNSVGTNTLTYTATDVSGNTATSNRTVVVRDTTPPTISWSFTNLVLAANSNCVALMTNVTGTNFILATDLSGALTLTQNPTNNATLPLGTNVVVITVADASGNKSYSTNRIVVRDQTPPAIAITGFNPMTSELGSAFTDPGVTASDACSGLALLQTNGTVNVNAVGTNTLTYTAVDGSGNTNTATRTVVVRDTTPPIISWSFTNLVLAANSNCIALMPDVTGTNFILATDLSGPLAVSQSPPNAAVLMLGTNVVVVTIQDAFGNAAYSTNTVTVQDQTPPVILSGPQSQTNTAGTSAGFTVAATACTPLAFQWHFNTAALTAQTNSTLTLSNLTTAAAGNYFVVAATAGGFSTSAVATLTVDLLPATVAVASSGNPAGFKDPLHFTAGVTPTNASGTIQFFTNSAAFDSEILLAGQAVSTNLASLPRGTNLVTAVYSGDATYLPATNSLAQVVTNHPPFGLPAFYTDTASFSLAIPLADLATNWSDVDGDTVVLAEVGISTNGITLSNNSTALVYFNSNNVADQFTCTITDGWGGTNLQTVTIAPALPPDTAPVIHGVAVAANGSVSLNLGGAPGSTYILETTTNFLPADWLPLATNTLDTNGVWQFNDAQATNFIQRFYRLKLAP